MHFVLEKYLTTCIKKQRIAENGGCDESTTDKKNSVSLPFSLSFLKEVYSGRMGSDGVQLGIPGGGSKSYKPLDRRQRAVVLL